jgi:hypothetical protein
MSGSDDHDGRPRRGPWRQRLPGIVLALLLIGAGVAGLVQASRGADSPVIEDVPSTSSPSESEPASSPAATPTATGTADDDAATEWDGLTVDETLDRLATLAADLTPTGPPEEGRDVVAIRHEASLRQPDADRVDLDRVAYRWTADGSDTQRRSLLGNAAPGDGTLAGFHDADRTAAAADVEEEDAGAGDPRDVPDGVVDEAAARVAGADDPFGVVHDAFALTWATDQLAAGQAALLTSLRGAAGVEAAGSDVDLLGRDVIVIVGPVDDDGVAEALLFDAATGAFAGAGQRSVTDGWLEVWTVELPTLEG